MHKYLTMRNVIDEPAPDESDWNGFDSTEFPDGVAYDILFGKTAVQAQELFHRSPINNIEELQVVPDAVFSYYFLALADYLKTPRSHGNCVAASAYMWILEQEIGDRQRSVDRDEVAFLFDVAVHIAENQDRYNATTVHYGNFADKIDTLRTKLLL